jgi:CubicO group peptidase (beta-lactamase class C family)
MVFYSTGRALALAAVLVLTTCGPARPPSTASDRATQTALSRELDSLFAAKSPSGAFLFAIGDELIFRKGYGVLTEGGTPLTDEAVFPVGSLTKQFTAAAVLQLAARGKLSLDDRLQRFFPEAPDDKKAITVRQLLAHKSGLSRNAGDVYDRVGPEEARRLIFAKALDAAPGERHNYSNSGYILLGQIVEKVSARPLGDYFERHLFRPAGMKRTGYPSARFAGAPIPRGYDRPKFKEKFSGTPMTAPGGQDPRFRYGNGGVLSTVGDLHRWVRALASGRLLPRAWVEQMQTPHADITPDRKFRYGYA